MIDIHGAWALLQHCVPSTGERLSILSASFHQLACFSCYTLSMSHPLPDTLLLLPMDPALPFPSAMSGATESQRTLSDDVPSLTKTIYSSPNLSQAYKTLPPLFHSPEHHRGLSQLFLPSDTISSQHRHLHVEDIVATAMPRINFNSEARMYSSQFPANHQLNLEFVQTYHLEDELGSGGYGFVLTAFHRTEGHEVAVKFIIKNKVPEHAWMEDEIIGRLPAEVVLLSYVDHENVVKCLDIYEDSLYFYLVRGFQLLERAKSFIDAF